MTLVDGLAPGAPRRRRTPLRAEPFILVEPPVVEDVTAFVDAAEHAPERSAAPHAPHVTDERSATDEPDAPVYGRFDLRRATGSAPVLPLLILFGLNAVDELDRTAFSVLTPEIKEHFGLSNQGILGLITAFSLVVLLLSLPIAHQADRRNRLGMARTGATAWAGFSLLTGFAPTVAVLMFARMGSGIGKAVNEPTHNGLLTDYYPPETRARVFYLHRLANSAGQFTGPALAGLLATWFTWRTPFFVFAVPTIILVVLSGRLSEPVRGLWDRRAAGADASLELIEEEPLPFREAWKVIWAVRSLRRVFFALPFLSASLIGLAALLSLFWEEVYGLSAAERGFLESASEVFQVVGIAVGAVVVQRTLSKNPASVVRLLAVTAIIAAGALAVLALSPYFIGSAAGRVVFSVLTVALIPGIYAVGSLVIPSRTRSLGFSAAGVFALPGILFLPVAGGIGDAMGLRAGMLVLIPVYLLGSMILASAARFVNDDIEANRLATLAAADAIAAASGAVSMAAAPTSVLAAPASNAAAIAPAQRNGAARRNGTAIPSALGDSSNHLVAPSRTLLSVRGVNASYGQTQVLFDVDLDVAEGEIVALLGTNGAGKSTVLKAVSGLLAKDAGSVTFDGRDITGLDANATAQLGIAQVPGGRGVFPSLTVAENLRVAGWLFRGEKERVKESTARVLDLFPRLKERMHTPAGALSGGEQQMLSLSQAFIAKPKLLMIDELSLGLAPTIVERLLQIVRDIHAGGTTVILVEQSVSTALRLAERAVFMEKGAVRFEGPTADLLERTDILRAVYLKGSGGGAPAQVTREDRPSPDEVLAQPTVLSVNGLTKTYGGVTAVHDVSFDLHQGQVLGLIGPNGAGKTTIFDLISGFQRLDSGTITLFGKDVTDWPAFARARGGIGRMFQDARLWGTLTVKESIVTALERHVDVGDPFSAMLGLPSSRESEVRLSDRAEELIELVGLNAFRDKFIGELSTGSRRMVEIAALLGIEPKILLLDEASSGIAQKEAEALGPILMDVKRELGASILIIEHSMPLLTSVADHLVALDSGMFVTEGEPEDVLTHPAVVESYLGGSELP